ncbi:MAG TPA: hypothetical protein IAC19_01980 [Candidatus Ventricola gallistercoris]|nr:hypothetical protein [Candidatus Ventricola gallistercoris]
MGTFADSLFTVLLGWVRALVDSLWAILSADHTTILEFLGKNWLVIALCIIAAGLVIDWLVWLVRWQPYHLWALRVRRLLRLPPPDEDGEGAKAHAATAPQRTQAHAAVAPREESWLPLEQPVIDETQAQDVMRQAESVPDETLGAYPGMRYGAMASPRRDTEGTQRYAAIHSEGPGTAEVTRRRAEIDAWQQQIQEEARARAQAELAAREEKARQAAYEAEQARLAQEAYEAEQARQAQEEYERQMAEYERQKAQYERDLAEYERQKAAYEAELARVQREEAEASQDAAAGEEDAARQSGSRRRRAPAARTPRTYSDYVSGEAVSELPDPPQWPDVSSVQTGKARTPAQPRKKGKVAGGLVSRVAKMIEPEEEEIASIASLPPRVDMHEAYKPAKKPEKRGPRKR